MGFIAFVTVLALLASISPLLTFTALFQQKEWRLDRLQEHLRHEGWFRQLEGFVRPIVVLLYGVLTFLTIKSAETPDFDGSGVGIAAGLFLLFILTFFLLAIVSGLQFILRKQRIPVWTSKSILVTGLAIIVSIAIATILILFLPIAFPVIVLVQPLSVFLAWLILKPIDTFLKHRVMNRARMLRSGMKNVTVIGIAGSVGKTTTKELIKHLLQDKNPIATPAHVNTEMGVAQWLLKQHVSSGLFIVEMGAYRKGEIALLCSIAQPTIGVVTALGSDHLALFGSEEAIVEANGELIESLPVDGHAFLNGENEGSRSLASKARCPVTRTPGVQGLKDNEKGLSFSLNGMTYDVPLHGAHNITNVLLAIAVAKHLGIPPNRIQTLLCQFKPVAHTFNVRNERGVMLLDDSYNISPLSFHAALDWAANRAERPRVLLTSSLQETGPDEEKFLRELGTKAAGCIERVVFTTKREADVFEKAFGKPIEILGKDTLRTHAGSALLAVGRMPLSTIQKLLPTS